MNSPIFDQLAVEFAAKGKKYEDFSRFSTPAFVWGAVDLTKKTEVPTPADDDTMSFAVVTPIAVMSLGNRGSAA